MTTTRDEMISDLRSNLRTRTGRSWSVRGGKGSAWGWVTISAPPARCDRYGHMTDEDRATLAAALGLPTVPSQGEQIPASDDYRNEYRARAAGQTPTVVGAPYWD